MKPILSISLLLSLGVVTHAATGPIRVLYFDAPGTEQTSVGPLHTAMRDLGRDAIWFDYATGEAPGPADLARYDAVVVRPKADGSIELKNAITVADKATPEQIRTDVLASLSVARKADWEKFLAQRDAEKREANPNVANYERRPQPITFQHPFSVKGSKERTQVPADMRLELFASEPEIGKPIAFAWDERGRLWVCETRDYPHGVKPNGEGNDSVKICEDTDGDGKADKFTVFADKLNLATALVFVNGGILVSEARHMLFLKDTDGDDKADVRQAILPGWGTGDTHAMQSNLGRGFDNWLYGAVGYSNFRGNVGGKDQQFGQGVFRFKADGSALEFLHQYNNNTWGFGLNAEGDVFGSTANGHPTFYGYLPAHILTPTQPGPGRRGGGGGGGGGGFRPGYRLDDNPGDAPAPTANVRRLPSAKSLAPGMRMHPNTPNVRMVDNFGGYTAAAGHAFMVSDALPPRLQGKALVTEPTAKLIGIMDIQRDGAGYKASDGFNLLASADEWMSPIFADVGPDGAIWVIDFYSFIIQHNPTPSLQSAGVQATTGKGGAYKTENDLRDQSHGRIYRVVWKDGPKSSIKSLAKTKPAELVAALDSGNQFWCLTAQGLIVDNKLTNAAPALKKRVRSGTGGKGVIHALWSLEGIGALDKDTHQAALLSKDPAVRRNAIRALPANGAGRQLFFSSSVIQDPDLVTRQVAFVKLAEFPTIPEIKTVVAQLSRVPVNNSDSFLNDTLTLLGRIHKVADVGENEVKVTAGDTKRGEELFYTSPTAQCAACHTVKGKGGDVGPILDGIAVRADKAYILESLMDPNAKLAKGFEGLTISPMPPLGVLLKEQELADILTFLDTLKTPPKDGIIVPVKRPDQYE